MDRLILLGVALLAACAPAPRTVEPSPETPPATTGEEVEAVASLVESVPRGTSLGSPTIDDTHDVWIDMIRSATTRVDIGQFYAADGPGADRFDEIGEALAAAARRGVEVRILVDGLFAETYGDTLARLEALATVRTTDAWRPGVQHAKYLVVDGRDLYVGSANFDWRSLEHIHEIGLRVEGKGLGEQLADLFERDWRRADGGDARWGDVAWEAATLAQGGRLRLVASPKGALPDANAWELDALLHAFRAAEDRIVIQLLDYDAAYRDGRPFTLLDDAIRAAAGRGVRVRMMLSHWQAKDMKAVKALAEVEGIEIALVTIPTAPTGFIPFARVAHAKYAAFDGAEAWIGSSNWKGDYFDGGRNVGVMVESPALVADLEGVFGTLWLSGLAEVVDPQRDYPAPRIQ